MTLLRVVVDRVKVVADARTRITDSVETSYQEGGGAAWAIQLARRRRQPITHQFSERFECRTCGIPYEDPQPRLFSFNNPFGACPTCHGFGNIIELDQELVVPDPSKSINQGAIEPWTKPHYRSQLAELKRAAKTEGRTPRRAVGGSDAGRNRVRDGRRWRRLRRRARILPLARAQEIQGPRPRVPQPLSRLPDVPGLPGHAAAPRSARRARRRRHDRQGVGAHGSRSASSSSPTCSSPKRKPRSPTRC